MRTSITLFIIVLSLVILFMSLDNQAFGKTIPNDFKSMAQATFNSSGNMPERITGMNPNHLKRHHRRADRNVYFRCYREWKS